MPSDSHFAVALRNQQEAEREEQKRIKNHILNLDLQDSGTDHIGTSDSLSFDPFLFPNPNLPQRSTPLAPLEPNALAHNDLNEGFGGAAEKHQYNASLTSRQPSNNAKIAVDKSSSNRRGDRARKLQLSDVDWYDQAHKPASSRTPGGGCSHSPPCGCSYDYRGLYSSDG